jgi:MGT family glycosyltransferase
VSASFWFISAPLYSHTDWGGFLKTALALQASGSRVLWISGEAIRGAVQAKGLAFHTIRETGWLWPPPPAPDPATLHPQDAVTLRYTRALNTWLSEDIVAEAAHALIELAAEIGAPDVIVTDPFLSASALAAEAIGVPMAVCGWPAQGDLNAQFLFPVQRHLGTESQRRLAWLCDQFDLKGVNFSGGPTPAITSPHLHLCYFTSGWYAAEIDQMLPQNRFVGGSIDAPQEDAPAWLNELPVSAPLAVITLGSVFTGDLGFFSWAAQAAAREGFVPVVAIGWNPIAPEKKAELIRALPKSTRLLNWIPFDHVLPRAQIMIHHGGMGTTHYAAMYGLPQIVVPHAADQRIQARRVAQAKVGLHLTAHDVRQGMLAEAVRALRNDDRVRRTAHDLAAEMSALGGPERAAESLMGLVRP